MDHQDGSARARARTLFREKDHASEQLRKRKALEVSKFKKQ